MLDMFTGKKTYAAGLVMVLHALSTMVLSGHVDQLSVMECLNGLAVVFLRKAID